MPTKYRNDAMYVDIQSGFFWCPSESDSWKRFADAETDDGAFHMSYAYFAHADEYEVAWDRTALARDKLTAGELDPARILMQDDLYMWEPNAYGFHFTHGVDGPRGWDWDFNDSVVALHPGSVLGLNQLYGDGHVSWKSGRELQLNEFNVVTAQTYTGGFLQTLASGMTIFDGPDPSRPVVGGRGGRPGR